jgi:hypothetical protein
VIDCPESHSQIEKVLCNSEKPKKEINKATDDPKTGDRIQNVALARSVYSPR